MEFLNYYFKIVNVVLFIFAWLAMDNPSLEFILVGVSVVFLYFVVLVRFVDRKKAFGVLSYT